MSQFRRPSLGKGVPPTAVPEGAENRKGSGVLPHASLPVDAAESGTLHERVSEAGTPVTQAVHVLSVPNPGSAAAVALSCTCPRMDNRHGRGYLGQPGIFVMAAGCPLHGTSLPPANGGRG